MCGAFHFKNRVEKELLYRHCFSTCSVEPHGFAKGCVSFRETEMHNGGRVLLAVLNSTLIIPSLIARRQSIAPSIQKHPDCSQITQHSSPYAVDVPGETIRLSIILRLAVDFVHVLYIEYKHMLVFNCIFDVLWTRRSSSVSSIASLRVP